MGERTEAQKTEEMLERQLAEQRLNHEAQLKVTQTTAESRICELRESFEDRKKELIAQNDGMLGVVGRVHGENEILKKRIAELEPALSKVKDDLRYMEEKAKIAIEQDRQGYQAKIDAVRQEAYKEIVRLKEQLRKSKK